MNERERKELERDNAEWGIVFVGSFVLYCVAVVVVLLWAL